MPSGSILAGIFRDTFQALHPPLTERALPSSVAHSFVQHFTLNKQLKTKLCLRRSMSDLSLFGFAWSLIGIKQMARIISKRVISTVIIEQSK